MPRPILVTDVCLANGVHAPRTADVLMADGCFRGFADPGSLAAMDVVRVVGQGRFLVPGLWESHTHMMMGVHGDARDKVAGVKHGLQGYLSRGITTVVDLGCPEDVMNVVRSEIGNQPSAYPAFFFAGPVFTGVNGWPLCMTCDHTSSWQVAPDSPVEAMVDGLADKVDFIKIIYDGLPGGTDKFPAVALRRVVRAAHAHGKRVMVHVRSKADLVEAVRAGADGIEHIFQPETPQHFDEAVEAAALMADHGVFWCPTLTTYEQIAHLGSAPYLDRLHADGITTSDERDAVMGNPFFHQSFPRVSADEALARFDYGRATLRLFAERGVKIVAGSDVAIAMGRAGAVLRELQLFGQAGLDPAAIIRSATVDAAGRLGLSSAAGTFTPGAPADAILLKADPLATIDALVRPEYIDAVFRAGEPVDRSNPR